MLKQCSTLVDNALSVNTTTAFVCAMCTHLCILPALCYVHSACSCDRMRCRCSRVGVGIWFAWSLFLSLGVECSKHDAFNFAYSISDNMKPLCWNVCTVSFWLPVTFEFLNDDWCHEIPSAKNQHVVHNQNGWRICFMLWPILVSSLGGNVLPPVSPPAHSLFFYVLVFFYGPSPSLEGYGNRILPRLLLENECIHFGQP